MGDNRALLKLVRMARATIGRSGVVDTLQSYIRWGSVEEVAAIRKHIESAHMPQEPKYTPLPAEMPDCGDPSCPSRFRPKAMPQPVDRETCGHCGDREPCDACPFFPGCPRHNGAKDGLSRDEPIGGMVVHQEPAKGYRDDPVSAPIVAFEDPGFFKRLRYWFEDRGWFRSCAMTCDHKRKKYSLRAVFFPNR